MLSRRSIWMARAICNSFADQRPLAARLDQPSDLHGQRRAARDDMAMRDELQDGPAKCQRIDAVMVVETPVLIGDQHAQKLRIDIGNVGLQPPAALRRCKGAQQLAVGIEHLGRNDAGLVERRRKGAVCGLKAKDQPCRRQRQRRQDPIAIFHRSFMLASYCWAASTSMRPVAVRAENCGRYMSSTLAAG